MKYLILKLALSLGLISGVSAQTAADYYAKGEAALKAGKILDAKAAYQAALKLEPNHGNAKFRLLSMKNLSASAKLNARKAQLKSIILPKVVFEDLTLEESLEALGVMIEKASEERFIPNFVIDDPSNAVSQRKVNLRLRNIPASVALKYVLSQAKARELWDPHVITVRPMNGASTPPKASVTEKK